MSDEKNEGRINIEDLPQAEQELTAEDAKKVQGGLLPAVRTGDNEDATGKKKNPKPSSGEGGGSKGQVDLNSYQF